MHAFILQLAGQFPGFRSWASGMGIDRIVLISSSDSGPLPAKRTACSSSAILAVPASAVCGVLWLDHITICQFREVHAAVEKRAASNC